MARFTVLRIFALALVFLLARFCPARASIITTGDVDPGASGIQADPWTVGGALKVGDSGTGALTVKAGGVVSNSTGRIGDQSNSTGQAMVTGADSQWNNSERLVVGRSGNGTLNVEADGIVSNTLGFIGRYASSTGVVTVIGPGSQWNNSSTLYVGWYGDGTMDVEASGAVSSTSSYIGRYASSTGVVTVTGIGTEWNNSNSMYVGGGSSGSGGTGTLIVNNSSVVTISNTTKLWPGGTINLDGGTLDVGTLDLAFGTFNMLDGILHADSVIGNINVQGGTVSHGHSPGVLSVSGNYFQGDDATLEIELAGTENGDYDQLQVAGTMETSGALEVQLLEGFSPMMGNEFQVFDGGAMSGTFSSMVFPDLLGNLSWDSSQLYTSGTLSVIPEPTTLALQAIGILLLCHQRWRY